MSLISGPCLWAQAQARSTSNIDAGDEGDEEPELTAQHHDKDPEHFLIVRVGGNVAKANWDEAGEGEVERCAIAALQKSRGL